MSTTTGHILPGLWRFEAPHPEWTEADGGAEGWERVVAWWTAATSRGLLLIDPLVADWDDLDRLVGEQGGCAGIVRTIHWHERSIADAVARYGAEVWAGLAPDGAERAPHDHSLSDGATLWDGIRAFSTERDDEIALWLPHQAALIFGDAMLMHEDGQLRMCPESWTQPEAGRGRLRAVLGRLRELPAEHVLVSHGPLVLGEGLSALEAALQ